MANINAFVVCPHAQWVRVAGPGDEYTIQLFSDGGRVYLIRTDEDPPPPTTSVPPGGQRLAPISEHPMLQMAGELKAGEYLYAWAKVIERSTNGLTLSVTVRTPDA